MFAEKKQQFLEVKIKQRRGVKNSKSEMYDRPG